MGIKSLLGSCVVIAALGLPRCAGEAEAAEATTIAELREDARALKLRASATSELAAKTMPALRKESDRIVATADARRRAVEARLDMLELAGSPGQSAKPTLAALTDLQQKLDSAGRLLSIVESWHRPAR